MLFLVIGSSLLTMSFQWISRGIFTFVKNDSPQYILVETACFNCMFLSCQYAFPSESKLYSCLNVKKLLGQNRREIWSLSDCNWTRTHNHLVGMRTLNCLAKLAKLGLVRKRLRFRLRTNWLWVRVQLRSLKLLALVILQSQ